MDVTLVRDLEALAALKEEWQALLGRCRPNHVFMTWHWASTWWRYFGEGRELFVLALRDKGELVGLVPLALFAQRGRRASTVRCLHFLGYRAGKRLTDYMDIVAVRKPEVMEAAFAYLRGRQHLWDVIELWDVLENSDTIPVIGRAAAGAGFPFFQDPIEKALYVRTDADWETYYRTHVRDRREFERRMRRLGDRGDLEETHPDVSTRNACVGALMELYRRRWNAPADAVARYRDFYCDLLDRVPPEWIACSALRLDARLIAAQISLLYGGTLYHLATAYDAEFAEFSPGRIQLRNLLNGCFLDANVSGCYFGRGAEPYKYEWATGELSCCRLHVTNAHMSGGLGVVLRRLPPALRRPLMSAREAGARVRPRPAHA